MPNDRIVRECTRSFAREGRAFTATYLLGEGDDLQGKRFFIRVELKETADDGTIKESRTDVNCVFLSPEIGNRIFEAIAGAEDPVFPVHVPDIVRDQISATALMEVRQA